MLKKLALALRKRNSVLWLPILLSALTLGSWLTSSSQDSVFPKINPKSLFSIDYYSSVGEYLSSRNSLKPVVVRALNNGSIELFSGTPNSQVLVGRTESGGPELYYSGDFTEPCSQLSQFEEISERMSSLNNFVENTDVSLFFIVAPNKSSFHEFSAGGIREGMTRCSDENLAMIKGLVQRFTFLKYAQPTPDDPSSETFSYWHGDTHWTPTGGNVLANLLVTGDDNASRVNMQPGTPTFRDEDLWRMLGFKTKTLTQTIEPVDGYGSDLVSDAEDVNMKVFISENSASKNSSALIVHDSFVQESQLFDQIAPLYGTTYFIAWDHVGDLSTLPKVDTIVFESVERISLGRMNFLINNIENYEVSRFKK
jgi:hypothetical protein